MSGFHRVKKFMPLNQNFNNLTQFNTVFFGKLFIKLKAKYVMNHDSSKDSR